MEQLDLVVNRVPLVAQVFLARQEQLVVALEQPVLQAIRV
jgi:hypothetical protein